MSTAVDAPVPPTRDFGAAWTAYALYAVGALLWWPAAIGLVICYVKRGDERSGFIDSHYRWLIRTFWLSLLGYVVFVAVVLIGIWPIVRDVIRTVIENQGAWDAGSSLHIDFSAILTSVGGATVGALGILFVWCWYCYRVIRGALRLHGANPTPG